MHWVTKPGTSHPEMYRITDAASKELRAIPGRAQLRRPHRPRRSAATKSYGVNFGENWISVDPESTTTRRWRRSKQAVDGYPGLYRDVQTYLKERIKEVLTGAGESIVVRIFGPELRRPARQGRRGRSRR